MKIVKILSIKYLKILLVTLFSIFIANTNNVKFSFNSNLHTQNLALQKALLSQEDIQILNIYSKFHKINTESIFFDSQNNIYESGKINNINILLKKSYPNNTVLKTIPLGNFPVKGIAKCNNIFYQLTGLNRKIFRYTFPNLDILTPISSDPEIGQVEGLAQLSDDFLVASNGTNKIFVLDCRNELNILKTINVEEFNGEEIYGLKDLVVVGEFIYAVKVNDNRVIKINPKTGKIAKFYNMINLIDYELKTKSLNNKEISQGATLSGITYDNKNKVFIITGKNWGHYYEVNLK